MNRVGILMLGLIAFAVQGFAQRLLTEQFARVDSTVDLAYGNAVDNKGGRQQLLLDFYEPFNDPEKKRPLIIYAHGGGFTEGTRKWPSIRRTAEQLAKRGYAVASIDYRLAPGFHFYLSPVKKPMTDAMHDMRAAVRFFRAHATKFRIDTANIIITGESAGAITAMMAAYVDTPEDLAAYPGSAPGDTEGSSGNPGFSSEAKAVMCLCGMIWDTTAIASPKDKPLLWVHGTADPLIPVEEAEKITQRAEHVGLEQEKVAFEKATHCPWYYGLPNWTNYLDSLVSAVSHFLYPRITGNPGPSMPRANSPAALRLPTILQDNMVIQQGKPFSLWGWALPGEEISYYADWSDKKHTVLADASGYWSGQIAVPKAKKGDFRPRRLTVVHRSDTLHLGNLLIGEVWLCAGQSNMDMMLNKLEGWYPGVLDYKKEIAAANYPAIRLFKTHAAFNREPQQDLKGRWEVCTPQSAGNFSGVAYYFGRELFHQLNVPVGLVVSAVAGASAQAFTGRPVLSADTLLSRHYLNPYEQAISTQQQVDSLDFFTKVTRPTLVYNAMIHPLEPLSIRGFVFYQGESNHVEGKRYTYLAGAMLNSWREHFGRGDLPFYFTQIAPYKTESDPTGAVSAFFREAQTGLLQWKHTGMAVTTDVGEIENIHPSDKRSVGIRLAKSALRQTYGFRRMVYKGPQFSSINVRGDTVRVAFDKNSIGSGLNTRDGQQPQHFFLAGQDRKFFPAEARIVNNQVWLSSAQVRDPVAVRYAFKNAVITNLQNREGLPAIPFRTDQWDDVY